MAKSVGLKDLDTFKVDKVFQEVDANMSPLVKDVWEDKYQWSGETFNQMCVRVSKAVHEKDTSEKGVYNLGNSARAMASRLWMPAGRILAGAGTPKRVTLLNCFVNAKLEDDMASITEGLGNTMLTQQQGGGIGTDFSPLRPPGAILRRTGSIASGPGPFIDTFDSAGTTIRSAGDRRGAQMGTLICTHPFLPEFITAKRIAGKWTNFNVSVLVTDAFMGAVADDEDWLLHHAIPPAVIRESELSDCDFRDDEGVMQFVYSIHKARELWDMIIGNTYEWAEPGVIFIDRVNDLNNLGYVEDIQCTNPCGEQPLPPHGCCDLGAVNITRMVDKPFTEEANFRWDYLEMVARIGTRFLDNVIDVTNYPLPQQREEEFNKRRIGNGISGLADAMHFQGMRYGSVPSIKFAESVMRDVCYASYRESIELAKEKGPFPLFDRDKFLDRPFIRQLPEDIQQGIADHGIRNGVLLTIAPTGTTSIAYGNNSSGLEPVFAHSMHRKVRQPSGDWQEYPEMAYGARVYLDINPDKSVDDLPVYMNVCEDVKIHEHVRIQEVCQRWVDASISKTINVPKTITYEEFKDVYQLAYESGCKGCTTYRPSEVRGSILSTESSTSNSEVPAEVVPEVARGRPEFITSRTAKIRWQGLSSALYLTIGYVDGKPYEVFLNSKDQKSLEWTMALTLLMSMSLRKGIPLGTLAEEFQQIHALEGGWAENGHGKQQYWPSLIAYLGHKLKQMVSEDSTAYVVEEAPSSEPLGADPQFRSPEKFGQCPKCSQYALINQSGCDTCKSCGWSKC